MKENSAMSSKEIKQEVQHVEFDPMMDPRAVAGNCLVVKEAVEEYPHLDYSESLIELVKLVASLSEHVTCLTCIETTNYVLEGVENDLIYQLSPQSSQDHQRTGTLQKRSIVEEASPDVVQTGDADPSSLGIIESWYVERDMDDESMLGHVSMITERNIGSLVELSQDEAEKVQRLLQVSEAPELEISRRIEL